VEAFDVIETPLFGEDGFEGAVETGQNEPTFVWDGLDPVVLIAGGWFWTEVEVGGAVLFHHQVVKAGSWARCWSVLMRLLVLTS
jgi:hypothetical protein